jgi:glycosyltransferase involved in cell wall biosynthesis
VVFVNRVYWPDTAATAQLLTDLATALAATGWAVTVVTNHPNVPSTSLTETRAGVRVVRVSTTSPRGHGIGEKAMAFATFYLGSLWALAKILRRGTTLVVMTDPPLLGVFASLVARLRGAQVVHWIQDIYPEVAAAVTGHSWLKVLRPLRNAAWRNADLCVTVGGDMAEILYRAEVERDRTRVIPNWAPAGLEQPPKAEHVLAMRKEVGLQDSFVVAYSGNLGRVHDLAIITAAADLLRENKQVMFAFIGDGPQRPLVEADVAARRLPNVKFLPAQPREQLAVTLAMADVHLITLRPGCEHFVFPSKLYGIVAAGRPVIFAGPVDSELSKLVLNAGLGLSVASGDAGALAEAIESLAADPTAVAHFRSRSLAYSATVNFDHAADAWRRALEAC